MLFRSFASVTADDVEAALEKAGMTDIEKKDPPAGSKMTAIFTGKKDGKVITVTFGANAPTNRYDAEIATLEGAGAIHRDGRFLLAVSVEGDSDKSRSKALLDMLVVR